MIALVAGTHASIMLVAGRDPRSSERAARLARELEAGGHAVRVLRPQSAMPPASHVQARLSDKMLEIELTRALRAELPDVVHALAHAAGSSSQVPWIAERLGAPSIVSCEARAVLCHKETLVHSSGDACTRYDDPARCAACCGLHRRGTQFANRLEMAVGGLLAATLVLVGTAEDRELLVTAGMPAGRVRVHAEGDTAELTRIYVEVVGAR